MGIIHRPETGNACIKIIVISFVQQLGTFFVNGEWVCGGLIAVYGEIRTHRSRTRSAESAGPLRVILDSIGYH